MAKIVFVVEEYDDLRNCFDTLLETYDYNMIEAKDGIEAVETFNQLKPNLAKQLSPFP